MSDENEPTEFDLRHDAYPKYETADHFANRQDVDLRVAERLLRTLARLGHTRREAVGDEEIWLRIDMHVPYDREWLGDWCSLPMLVDALELLRDRIENALGRSDARWLAVDAVLASGNRAFAVQFVLDLCDELQRDVGRADPVADGERERTDGSTQPEGDGISVTRTTPAGSGAGAP